MKSTKSLNAWRIVMGNKLQSLVNVKVSHPKYSKSEDKAIDHLLSRGWVFHSYVELRGFPTKVSKSFRLSKEKYK